MRGHRIELDIDDLVRRYQAGESPREIAITLPDVSAETIRRRLRSAGALLSSAEATRRRFADRPEARAQARAAQALRWSRRILDEDAIADAYRAGEAARSIRERFHTDISVVRRIVEQRGIPWRDMSAAGLNRVATEDPEIAARRKEFLGLLNVGRQHTQEVVVARAIQKQALQFTVGEGEETLRSWLADRGLKTVPQLAVDRYNIDIAAAPVAIEVWRSAHHPLTRPRQVSRAKHLADFGWRTLFVWVTNAVPLDERAADEAVSWVELTRRDPSALAQHRVIRGDGQEAPPPRTLRGRYPKEPFGTPSASDVEDAGRPHFGVS